MGLSIGIVGLPNVGKSTTFNALTKEQNAEAANYPFCTIEPNKAIVAVPDERVDALSAIVQPQKTIYSTIEFVDIAGLVQGASRGEGLGNKFLGQIRETNAIVHVVRCFEDENVVHVSEKPNPREDIEIVNTELLLADLEQLERKIERLVRQSRADKKARPRLAMAEQIKEHIEAGRPVSTFPAAEDALFQALNREMRLLTSKTVIYVANVDEAYLTADNAYVKEVRAYAAEHGSEMIKLCAKLEEEMAGLTDAERQEFLEVMGVGESGLDKLIRRGFRALHLISFFTTGPKEVHAWTIKEGTLAPQAAGEVHTDFEKGFIRAEVIPVDVYLKYGSEAAVKAAGEMRIEGKEYVVQDGDVIRFRFNV